MARERTPSRRRGVRRRVGVGSLHGSWRPHRPGRRELDHPGDGRRGHGARDRRSVRAQRDEPPPGRRRADGVDPPDRERWTAGARHRHRWRAEGARGLRHRLPAAARARRPPRGGRRGHPGAVDRRAGDARLAVLSAGRGVRLSRPGPPAADHHRGRDRRPAHGSRAGSATAGRRSTTTSRRTCRSISSRSPRPAGDARTRASSSGSRATGWATSRSPESPWVEAPRETWERWQAAGADGAIVLARTTADVDALVEATDRW